MRIYMQNGFFPQLMTYHWFNLWKKARTFTSWFLCLISIMTTFCVSLSELGIIASEWVDIPCPQGTCSLIEEKKKATIIINAKIAVQWWPKKEWAKLIRKGFRKQGWLSWVLMEKWEFLCMQTGRENSRSDVWRCEGTYLFGEIKVVWHIWSMRYSRQVRQNGEDLECQSLDFILQAMGGHWRILIKSESKDTIRNVF